MTELIRERYSVSDEFAINRKFNSVMFNATTVSDSDTAEKAIEEFRQYSEYAEQCKVMAQELLTETTEEAGNGSD